jgi:hypothetical protein
MNTIASKVLVLAVLCMGEAALAQQQEEKCRCKSVKLYSSNRFMRGDFALECAGHGQHSTCDQAGKIDIVHSAGCGAMTGNLTVVIGGQTFKKKCADNHKSCHKDLSKCERACFLGPSACDGGGSWANVCSCCREHSSAAGNAKGAFQSGPLSDNREYLQLTLGTSESKKRLQDITFSGPCGQVPFSIQEFVQENDFPSSDAMGTLEVSGTLPAEKGKQRVSRNAEATLTNNTVVGTFGATLTLETDCETSTCCKKCGPKGKACGDTCIAMDKNCSAKPGCACD